MTTNLAAALKKLRAVTNEFYDALEQELKNATVPTDGTVRPQPSGPARRAVAPAAAAQPLPAPVTPARRPVTQLTASQRIEHLPAATEIALKVLKLIGEAPTLLDGVVGQLALNRVPHDDTLVSQALAAARQQVAE